MSRNDVVGVRHRWSATAKKQYQYMPSTGTGGGVGPGEELLADAMGGKVQGGSKSYDVIDATGRMWEVKAPDAAGRIRIARATSGKLVPAFTKRLHDAIDIVVEYATACNDCTFVQRQRMNARADIRRHIAEFIECELSEIVRGEMPMGRLNTLIDIVREIGRIEERLHRRRRCVTDAPVHDVTFTRPDGDVIKCTVPMKTYVAAARACDLPSVAVGIDPEDVLRTIVDDQIVNDVDAYVTSLFETVSPRCAFDHVDGVAIVDVDGYMLLTADEYDAHLKFACITASQVKYKFTL